MKKKINKKILDIYRFLFYVQKFDKDYYLDKKIIVNYKNIRYQF